MLETWPQTLGTSCKLPTQLHPDLDFLALDARGVTTVSNIEASIM